MMKHPSLEHFKKVKVFTKFFMQAEGLRLVQNTLVGSLYFNVLQTFVFSLERCKFLTQVFFAFIYVFYYFLLLVFIWIWLYGFYLVPDKNLILFKLSVHYRSQDQFYNVQIREGKT